MSSGSNLAEARALLPDLLLEFKYLPCKATPIMAGPSFANATTQPFCPLSGPSTIFAPENVYHANPTATSAPETVPEISLPSFDKALCYHCEPRRFRGQDRSLLHGPGSKKSEEDTAPYISRQASQAAYSSHNSHTTTDGSHLERKTRREDTELCFDANENAGPVRKLRCLCCQMDLGHGKCIGARSCDLCRLSLPSSAECDPGLLAPFLNYRYWQDICDDLRAAFNSFANEVTLAHYRDLFSCDSMSFMKDPPPAHDLGPIILELNFNDKVQEALDSHHKVVFWPQFQQEQYLAADGNPYRAQRAPAIDITQLDEFVKAGVWGLPLWNADDSKLEFHERTLWPKIRLFVGYCSIITNLATTVIQSPNSITRSIYQAVATEFVYALGYRAQMLHYEIGYECDNLVETGAFRDHPALLLYGLETLYRLLLPMCTKDWLLPIDCHDNRLKDLQQNFYEHLQQTSNRILNLQCLISDMSQNLKRCGHGTLPEMVKFSRSEYAVKVPKSESEGKPIYSFPTHCVVTAYRHESFLLNRTPFQSDMTHQMRLVQVLGNSDDLLADFTDFTRIEPPCHCVTESNQTVYLRNSLVGMSQDSKGESSCYPTVNLDLNSTELNSVTQSDDASGSETAEAGSVRSLRMDDQSSVAPGRTELEPAPALSSTSSPANFELFTPNSVLTIEYLLPEDP